MAKPDPKKLKKLLAAIEEFVSTDEDEDEAEDEDEDEDEAPKGKKKPAKKPAKGKKKLAEDEDEDEEEDDDAPTLQQIRSLAVKASKATDGKEKVLAALAKHGSERLTEIDEDEFPALKEMLEKIIDDDDYDPRPKAKKGAKKPAAKKGKKKPADDEDEDEDEDE